MKQVLLSLPLTVIGARGSTSTELTAHLRVSSLLLDHWEIRAWTGERQFTH